MLHPAEQTLKHIEVCEPINDRWRAYIRQRAPEVQAFIDDLRAFAGLDPTSRPAAAMTSRADDLQRRLDAVLDHAAEPTLKGYYDRLTVILDDIDPSLANLCALMRALAAHGMVQPLLQDLANAVLGGDQEQITEQMHRLRARWRLCRWDRAEYSRQWLRELDK